MAQFHRHPLIVPDEVRREPDEVRLKPDTTYYRASL
jgi:hypothetical protein